MGDQIVDRVDGFQLASKEEIPDPTRTEREYEPIERLPESAFFVLHRGPLRDIERLEGMAKKGLTNYSEIAALMTNGFDLEEDSQQENILRFSTKETLDQTSLTGRSRVIERNLRVTPNPILYVHSETGVIPLLNSHHSLFESLVFGDDERTHNLFVDVYGALGGVIAHMHTYARQNALPDVWSFNSAAWFQQSLKDKQGSPFHMAKLQLNRLFDSIEEVFDQTELRLICKRELNGITQRLMRCTEGSLEKQRLEEEKDGYVEAIKRIQGRIGPTEKSEK